MRDRIVAAWRVLRGEWVAGPKVEEPNHFYFDESVFDSTASSAADIYWRRTA